MHNSLVGDGSFLSHSFVIGCIPAAVGQLWLGLCYWEAISYLHGIIILWKLGGVYSCGSYDTLGAKLHDRTAGPTG